MHASGFVMAKRREKMEIDLIGEDGGGGGVEGLEGLALDRYLCVHTRKGVSNLDERRFGNKSSPHVLLRDYMLRCLGVSTLPPG